MHVEPRHPQEYRWHYGPVRHYHVVFWRQPSVSLGSFPEGMPQEAVAWAANENDVLEARDVLEVIHWAEDEARRQSSIFTLYAVVDRGDNEGLVWLAGWNPTVSSDRNFPNRQPAGVDPVGGSSAEVYRRRDESEST